MRSSARRGTGGGWGWVKKSRESVEKINLHLRVGRVFFGRKLRALIKRLVGSAALPHRSNCKRPIRSISRYAPPIDSIRRHESRIRRLLRHPPAVRCSPPSIKRQFDRKKNHVTPRARIGTDSSTVGRPRRRNHPSPSGGTCLRRPPKKFKNFGGDKIV